ncbi:MAG: hypothetical protein QOJ85_644 [Solirubrobacteraceae bacterium]|jgi:hypothetical protein|nr:hypothetical protein [Solirubrobacteraceae bacterium]
MDPYAALLELTEREHALVVAGSWEDLAAVDAERRTLLAGLPPRAPAGAAVDALERAAGLQAQTSALLSAQVAELRRSLGHMAQGRVTVQGYRGAGATAPASLDLAG